MKKLINIILLILFLMILTACNKQEKELMNIDKIGTLLFFSNIENNCESCEIQEEILENKIIKIYKDKINFINISPSKNEHLINSYGIKIFPTIIISDIKDNIVKRFAPGVQSAKNISQILDNLQ